MLGCLGRCFFLTTCQCTSMHMSCRAQTDYTRFAYSTHSYPPLHPQPNTLIRTCCSYPIRLFMIIQLCSQVNHSLVFFFFAHSDMNQREPWMFPFLPFPHPSLVHTLTQATSHFFLAPHLPPIRFFYFPAEAVIQRVRDGMTKW